MTAPKLCGFLGLTPEGKLEGWCYSEVALSERREVSLALNGVVFETVVAAQLRNDLAAAAIGDGYYGFVVAAPVIISPNSGQPATITALDCRTGTLIGQTVVAAEGNAASPTAVRLTQLEKRVNTLPVATVAMTTHQDLVGDGLRAIGAALNYDLSPADFGTWRLAAAMTRLLRPRPLLLTRAAKVSYVLFGPDSLEEALATIEALRAAIESTVAELIVVSDCRDPRIAYLPSLVNGIVLLRSFTSHSTVAVNLAALHAKSNLLVFLDPSCSHNSVELLESIKTVRAGIQPVIWSRSAPKTTIPASTLALTQRQSMVSAVCVSSDILRKIGPLDENTYTDKASSWTDFFLKCKLLAIPTCCTESDKLTDSDSQSRISSAY
jgi:hypothetical protein